MGIINSLKAQVNASLKDGRITLPEVKKLEKLAKAAPAGATRAAATTVLKRTLQGSQDKFEETARAELSKFLGTKVNLPDPGIVAGQDGVSYQWVPGGVLYDNGASASDVSQGQAGDCYLLSVLASMSRENVDLLKGAVRNLKDGTYSVRFYQPDAQGVMQPVNVRVDGQLPFKYGSLQYAHSPSDRELWVAVVEKAYAKWKGNSYDAIAHGGSPGQVMTDLTGRPYAFQWLKQDGDAPDAAYERLKASLAAGQLVNVATAPDGPDVPGLVKNHAYSVLGYEEVDGVKQLVVRNPWGDTEPGNDGRNDGLFRVPAEEVANWFAGAWTA